MSAIMQRIARKVVVGDGLTNDELLIFLQECKNATELLSIFGSKYTLYKNEFNHYIIKYSQFAYERKLVINRVEFFPDWSFVDSQRTQMDQDLIFNKSNELLSFLHNMGEAYALCLNEFNRDLVDWPKNKLKRGSYGN